MPVNTFLGRQVDVNEEGFLTKPEQWDEELAVLLASYAGVDELTEAHWAAVRFVRADMLKTGASPTLHRMRKVGGLDTKPLFELFPGKPAKKLAYVAGGPKPTACV